MPVYENPATYYTPNIAALYPGVDPAEAVLRITQLWDGVARIAPACRLLTPSFTPYYLSSPPNPYDPSNISPTPGGTIGYVEQVSTEWNGGTDISGQVKLQLRAFPGIGQFNTLVNYMRVYIQYYDGALHPLLGDMRETIYGPDGTLVPLGVPLGTYGFTIPDVAYGGGSEVWTITGVDPLAELRTLYPEHNYDARAGMKVTDYVRTILMMDHDPPDEGGRQPASPYIYPDPNNPALSPIGCAERGPNISSSRISLVASDIVFPSTFRIAYSETWLAGINRALASINYWPLDTDRYGNVVIAPMYDPKEQKTPDVTYESGDDSVLQDPVLVKINSQADIVNYVQVRCEDPTRPPLIAIAKNTALNSWISRPNIGKWLMGSPMKLDNVYNQAILQARADIELDLRSQGAESVDFSTWIDPFATGHAFCGLRVWSPDGKTLDVTSDPNAFLINHLTYDFDPGKPYSTFTVGRSVPL